MRIPVDIAATTLQAASRVPQRHHRPSMTDRPISWSAHPDIHNKPSLWEPRFGYGWQRRTTDLKGLIDHIADGGAFITAAMTSDHRTAAAFESTSLVAVDIDHGLTLDEFANHPLAGSACFVYSTPSHDPTNGKHRFRILFRLPETIHSGELYKGVVTILTNALGGDRSCTDPTRLFYGNSDAAHMGVDVNAVLDGQIISDAEAFLEQQRSACRDAASEVDEVSILRAIHVLEQVIEPTKDGQRDLFVRISAAARAGGDAVFPAWSDWASRGHHGSGANKRQSSERWFTGLKGSSLGTLFFLASEQAPNWRDGLPEALRSSEGYGFKGYSDTWAGYSYEDFLGDPDVTVPATPQASMFDASSPWAQVAIPAAPKAATKTRPSRAIRQKPMVVAAASPPRSAAPVARRRPTWSSRPWDGCATSTRVCAATWSPTKWSSAPRSNPSYCRTPAPPTSGSAAATVNCSPRRWSTT
jgi:hypothetical protein